jgi:hypothetical protein
LVALLGGLVVLVGADGEEFPGIEKRCRPTQQAIVTVIGRRHRERDPAGRQLDPRGTSLPGVSWGEAHLKGADLTEAHGLTVGQLQSAASPASAELLPEPI